MSLSSDDRLLLRRVFAWARANGWKHAVGHRETRGSDGSPWDYWMEHSWRNGPRGIVFFLKDADTPDGLIYDPDFDAGHDNTGLYVGREFMRSAGVQGVIDLLATIGILPVEFSSAYQAGRDALAEQLNLRSQNPRGTCGPCGRWIALRSDGMLRAHTADGGRWSGWCAGSRRKPRAVA